MRWPSDIGWKIPRGCYWPFIFEKVYLFFSCPSLCTILCDFHILIYCFFPFFICLLRPIKISQCYSCRCLPWSLWHSIGHLFYKLLNHWAIKSFQIIILKMIFDQVTENWNGHSQCGISRKSVFFFIFHINSLRLIIIAS